MGLTTESASVCACGGGGGGGGGGITSWLWVAILVNNTYTLAEQSGTDELYKGPHSLVSTCHE